MDIRLIGDRHDVIGFGLAGINGVECRTRSELVAALEAAEHDPSVALVIVSPRVAALGSDVIARLRDAVRLPIMIVLPDNSGDGDAERPHAA